MLVKGLGFLKTLLVEIEYLIGATILYLMVSLVTISFLLFKYSNGNRYLVQVTKTPDVEEVIN